MVCALVLSAQYIAVGWSSTPGNCLFVTPEPLPHPTPHHVAHGVFEYSGSSPHDCAVPFTAQVPASRLTAWRTSSRGLRKDGR